MSLLIRFLLFNRAVGLEGLTKSEAEKILGIEIKIDDALLDGEFCACQQSAYADYYQVSNGHGQYGVETGSPGNVPAGNIHEKYNLNKISAALQ